MTQDQIIKNNIAKACSSLYQASDDIQAAIKAIPADDSTGLAANLQALLWALNNAIDAAKHHVSAFVASRGPCDQRS